MKDLYTFDVSETEAILTYQQVSQSYQSIMRSLGVTFAVAEADSGNIGGTRSHEYHIISEAGEDQILCCQSCNYTANVETAVSLIQPTTGTLISKHSGDSHFNVLYAELASHIQSESQCFLKTHSDAGSVTLNLIVVPKNREINYLMLRKLGAFQNAVLSTCTMDVDFQFSKIQIVLDQSIQTDGIWKSKHPIITANIAISLEGDSCFVCASRDESAKLVAKKAIEVGHTFYLGKKYSEPLNARYKSATQESVPIEMCCFGLGISRIMAAVTEVSHDKDGIIWPKVIAPYTAVIIPVYKKSCERDFNRTLEESIFAKISDIPNIYGIVQSGDAIFDDRDVNFGVKIKDAMLIGYPFIIIAGKVFQSENKLEIRRRSDGSILISSNCDELNVVLED